MRGHDPIGGRERVFVGLGSNLGDREAQLARAVACLRATPGVDALTLSPVYETDPVGPPGQGPYLNAVAELRTTLAPAALLARLLAIETEAGRVRNGVRNEARSLDLDLLLYGERRIQGPELVVPHPRMHERGFVLAPLCDLVPDLVHPVFGEPVAALVARVLDPEAVRCGPRA